MGLKEMHNLEMMVCFIGFNPNYTGYRSKIVIGIDCMTDVDEFQS